MEHGSTATARDWRGVRAGTRPERQGRWLGVEASSHVLAADIQSGLFSSATANPLPRKLMTDDRAFVSGRGTADRLVVSGLGIAT